MSQKVRESNFELLRIVAILFITMHHLLINGIDMCGYNCNFVLNINSSIAVILNSLIVGGVNLFLLISGWYGIKTITKGIVRLVVDCFFYGLIACLLSVLFVDAKLSVYEVFNSIKFTNGWFVPNYMYLLFLSPIIEYSLKNVSLRVLRYWIMLFFVCQVYFGYILGFVDKNGYSAINFIFLYYVGRYLRYELQNSKKTYQTIGLVVWVLTGGTLGFVFLMASRLGHPIESLRWWSYNNPFVLIGSISLFVYFSYLKIQKSWINYFATSVFGIYLVSSNSLITEYRNNITQKIFEMGAYPLLFVFAICLVLFVGSIILITNKVRQPVLSKIEKVFEKIKI